MSLNSSAWLLELAGSDGRCCLMMLRSTSSAEISAAFSQRLVGGGGGATASGPCEWGVYAVGPLSQRLLNRDFPEQLQRPRHNHARNARHMHNDLLL